MLPPETSTKIPRFILSAVWTSEGAPITIATAKAIATAKKKTE